MCQGEAVGPLEESVGYALKQAAAALRAGLDAALRPLDLTVPQYACMELLHQRPGLSNAELARGSFVTRQSMNAVLRGLQDRGLVSRPATADHGRARPATLTADGRARLAAAGVAVRAVDERMLRPFSADRRRRLLEDLTTYVAASAATAQLSGPQPPQRADGPARGAPAP